MTNRSPLRTLNKHSFAASVILMTSLVGCAGTRVAEQNSAPVSQRIPVPRRIALVVEDASIVPEKDKQAARHRSDVQAAEAALTQGLTQLLTSRDLIVVPPGQSTDLILRCTVTEVRSGNPTTRLLVGYGAGKAILKVSTVLTAAVVPDKTLLSFTTRSTTGAMPGAGLGVVSAAGAVAGTAGALIGVPSTLRQGLLQETQQTIKRVDEQLADYFSRQIWPYSRPPKSRRVKN